jgi:hypothetical protein
MLPHLAARVLDATGLGWWREGLAPLGGSLELSGTQLGDFPAIPSHMDDDRGYMDEDWAALCVDEHLEVGQWWEMVYHDIVYNSIYDYIHVYKKLYSYIELYYIDCAIIGII